MQISQLQDAAKYLLPSCFLPKQVKREMPVVTFCRPLVWSKPPFFLNTYSRQELHRTPYAGARLKFQMLILASSVPKPLLEILSKFMEKTKSILISRLVSADSGWVTRCTESPSRGLRSD